MSATLRLLTCELQKALAMTCPDNGSNARLLTPGHPRRRSESMSSVGLIRTLAEPLDFPREGSVPVAAE